MSNLNRLLEARHSFGVARLELLLASEKLTQTGMFGDTIKEIDDTVADLTRSVKLLTKHIEN